MEYVFRGQGHLSTNMWAGVSFQKAEILSTGKEVDHVPRRIYTLGVNEKLNDKWRVGATLIGQSSSFVDTTNSEKMGSYALVNTTVGYKINATTHIDLQIRNLTNRTYYYAYDNVYAGRIVEQLRGTSNRGKFTPGNFYAANMPRSVFASVTAKF